jgi:hypothetical protein
MSVARQDHLSQLIRTPQAFHGCLSMKGFAPEPTQRAVEVPKLGYGNESGDGRVIPHSPIICNTSARCRALVPLTLCSQSHLKCFSPFFSSGSGMKSEWPRSNDQMLTAGSASVSGWGDYSACST